ncbi:MAG: Uma2 family endonuclease [Acidobacteria bacterium]|nr:Uma2 family endonuclease [Acidobacteriota bacterium]
MRIEATKKLFTVDEFSLMGQTGIFTEDDRVELVEGEIIELGMIGERHAAAVDRPARLFMPLALENRTNIRVRNPMVLDKYNAPLPGITLLAPRADFYVTHHPAGDEVLLAVEVADTTLRYDRNVKMPIYAKLGIRESWIEDIAGDVILVFRDPAPDGYKTCLTLHRGDSVSPLVFPGLVVHVDQLLG